MIREIILSATLAGCALLTPGNVNTALTDGQRLCIVVNAALDNPTIAQVCGIAGDVADIARLIEAVAALQRAQLAKARQAGVDAAWKSGVCK